MSIPKHLAEKVTTDVITSLNMAEAAYHVKTVSLFAGEGRRIRDQHENNLTLIKLVLHEIMKGGN